MSLRQIKELTGD